MTDGRVLGVDLGERRVGLALSDAGRVLASPYSVLARTRDRSGLARAILDVARDEECSTIVVGLPLSLDGTMGRAAHSAMAEVEALRTRAGAGAVPVPEIVVHDERLTTVTATHALIEAGVKRQARRALVDKVAAAVMLQAWLDTRPRSDPE